MHARPHIDARRIGMLEAKSGPSRVAFTCLALASSGLALRSGALRVGSFSLAAWLACRCHGECSFATAHASASRRPSIHSSLRVDFDGQPPQSHQSLHRLAARTMLPIGLSSLRFGTSILSPFTSDAPSV